MLYVFLIGEFPNKTDGMVWLQRNRQTKHICIYRNSILVTVCTQPLYICTGSTVQTITMYLNIGFMYMRCYSANYHLALNHCIYLQEVQRKLSLCTQTLYLFTGSSAQTITMYSNIVFFYRKFSANYRHVHNHCIYVRKVLQRELSQCTQPCIYVQEVLQRKLSPCTQPCIYLCAWCATAQTITIYIKIVFIYKKYSSNVGHCIYVQEAL